MSLSFSLSLPQVITEIFSKNIATNFRIKMSLNLNDAAMAGNVEEVLIRKLILSF